MLAQILQDAAIVDGVDKRLKKVGLKAQDTGELFFDNVRVPAENLLGTENTGFGFLMQELPWERLQIAISSVAQMEAAVEWTSKYCRERKAFGKELMQFQNTQHRLAECMTEVQIARVFVDRCIEMLLNGSLDATTASMAKYWVTDLSSKVIDQCQQLHGGYGYMWEYPIARAWADARVARIYGGSNEIMKELIARQLPVAHTGTVFSNDGAKPRLRRTQRDQSDLGCATASRVHRVVCLVSARASGNLRANDCLLLCDNSQCSAGQKQHPRASQRVGRRCVARHGAMVGADSRQLPLTRT